MNITEVLHRIIQCWEIRRLDGVVIRGTNHNNAVVFDGEVFEPSNSGETSAVTADGALSTMDKEFNSVITDNRITDEDLAAGLYRQAEIVEYFVDWKFPFAGYFRKTTYRIAEIRFNKHVWRASIEGLTRYFQPPIGRVYTRNEELATLAYPYDARGNLDTIAKFETTVGDSGGWVWFTETDAEVDNRVVVKMADVPIQDDGYYSNGRLDVLSGKNSGLSFDVYEQTGRYLWLRLETPYLLQEGDEIAVVPGYNGTFEQARDKFNNAAGFRGFPYIPGIDSIMRMPDAR